MSTSSQAGPIGRIRQGAARRLGLDLAGLIGFALYSIADARYRKI